MDYIAEKWFVSVAALDFVIIPLLNRVTRETNQTYISSINELQHG
ncbi:MAG: hypothetical protein ACTSV2_11190 [Candidatus Thorarchaeota archaeon]